MGQPLARYPSESYDFLPRRQSGDKRPRSTALLPTGTPIVTAVAGAADAKFAGLAAGPLPAPMKSLTDERFGLISVVKLGIMEAPVAGLNRDSVYGGGVQFVSVAGERCTLQYLQNPTPGDKKTVGFLIKVLSPTRGLVCINSTE